MSTRRPTGVVTPDGSDPISGLVMDLRSLALTSNRPPTAGSQSEAQAIADALASTPYPATPDNGLYVWRRDMQALMRYDGAAWTLVAKSVPPATTLKQYDGVAILGASEKFIVAVSTWSGLSRAIVHYSLRIRPAGNAAGSIFVWDGDKEVPGSRIVWHSDGTDRDQFVSGTVLMAPTIGKDIGLYVSALGSGSSSATAGRATLQVSAY